MLEPQLLMSKIFNDLNLTTVGDQYLNSGLIEVAKLDFNYDKFIIHFDQLMKYFTQNLQFFLRINPELRNFDLICIKAKNANNLLKHNKNYKRAI